MKKLMFAVMMLVAMMGFSQTSPDLPVVTIGSMCDVGATAGATLLLPYFEVDSANVTGLDTLVGITNIDDDPIVAHVIVYNVDSFIVFDFNIYLTGYDVVTWSMRQLLVFGNYPNNGCTSNTYKFRTRYIDCNGDSMYFSQADAGGLLGSAGYAMDLACYPPAAGSVLTDRQCMLSVGSYDGWNSNYVGYVTIDANITCTGATPDNDNYYSPDYLDTNADATNDHGILEMSNILVGDMFYYDNAGSQADGYPLVHIEAIGESNTLAGHTWGMQQADFLAEEINTYYNKYNWWGPNYFMDYREALPIRWAFRYIGNAAFDGGTMVDVWRSHHWDWGPYMFSDSGGCNFHGDMGYSSLVEDLYVSGGSLYLTNTGLWRPSLIVFDEEENTTQAGGGPSPPPTVPGIDNVYLEAQRVDVTLAEGWPLVDESGWIGISFSTDAHYDTSHDWLNWFYGCNTTHAFELGCTFDQSWLNVRYQALNKYTVGLSGVAYLNSCHMVWDAVNAEFNVESPVY